MKFQLFLILCTITTSFCGMTDLALQCRCKESLSYQNDENGFVCLTWVCPATASFPSPPPKPTFSSLLGDKENERLHYVSEFDTELFHNLSFKKRFDDLFREILENDSPFSFTTSLIAAVVLFSLIFWIRSITKKKKNTKILQYPQEKRPTKNYQVADFSSQRLQRQFHPYLPKSNSQ
jgi:hypothetical protein